MLADLRAFQARELQRVEREVASAGLRIRQLDKLIRELDQRGLRWEQMARRRLVSEQAGLRQLLEEHKSGALVRRIRERTEPYVQCYDRLAADRSPRAASLVYQQLQQLPDPACAREMMEQAGAPARRGRKRRALTIQMARDKLRSGRRGRPGPPGSDALFTVQVGPGVLSRRTLPEVQVEGAEAVDLAPALPGVLGRPAGLAELAAEGAVERPDYTADSWRTMDRAKDRSATKGMVMDAIELSYDLESLGQELRSMTEQLPVMLVAGGDLCDRCRGPMMVMVEQCLSVCPRCKVTRGHIQTSVQVRSVTKDLTADQKKGTKQNPTDEFFNRWMGLGRRLPDDVLGCLIVLLRAMGVRGPGEISLPLVHHAVDALRNDKWSNGGKIQAFCMLTGQPPPRLGREQQVTLSQLRRAAEFSPEQAARLRRGGSSLIEYSLFKCIQLCGWDYLAGYLYLHHAVDTEAHLWELDGCWREVCARLDWEFIPTVERVGDLMGELGLDGAGLGAVLARAFGRPELPGVPGGRLWARLNRVMAASRLDLRRRVTPARKAAGELAPEHPGDQPDQPDQDPAGDSDHHSAGESDSEPEPAPRRPAARNPAARGPAPRGPRLALLDGLPPASSRPGVNAGVQSSTLNALQIWWLNFQQAERQAAARGEPPFRQLLTETASWLPVRPDAFVWVDAAVRIRAAARELASKPS